MVLVCPLSGLQRVRRVLKLLLICLESRRKDMSAGLRNQHLLLIHGAVSEGPRLVLGARGRSTAGELVEELLLAAVGL